MCVGHVHFLGTSYNAVCLPLCVGFRRACMSQPGGAGVWGGGLVCYQHQNMVIIKEVLSQCAGTKGYIHIKGLGWGLGWRLRGCREFRAVFHFIF